MLPNLNTQMLMRNLLLALLIQTTLIICSGFQVIDNEMEVMVKKACTGKMGLCFWENKKKMEMIDMEMEMDSEVNRRVLMMQKKYISYETLKKDVVPCSTPGAPYYNCHAVGQANPYSRGCSAISHCRNN